MTRKLRSGKRQVCRRKYKLSKWFNNPRTLKEVNIYWRTASRHGKKIINKMDHLKWKSMRMRTLALECHYNIEGKMTYSVWVVIVRLNKGNQSTTQSWYAGLHSGRYIAAGSQFWSRGVTSCEGGSNLHAIQSHSLQRDEECVYQIHQAYRRNWKGNWAFK